MLEDLYNLNKDTIEAIGRFTICWSLFENYYQDKNANIKKIKKLHSDLFRFEGEIEDFQEKMIDFLKNKQDGEIDKDLIEHYLYTDKSGEGGKEEIYNFLICHNSSIIDCLICIYRLRNNLLHGEKSIWFLNNQKDLIDSASNVLMRLVHPKVHSEYELIYN